MRTAMCVAIFAIVCASTSCGGGARPTLQSIKISPTSGSGSATFVATGTFSDGSTVTPLNVQWFFVSGVAIDPAPAYQLNTAPFTSQCLSGASGSFIVSAFAPQNPKSPAAGAMPENVWWDMIHASAQSEGGFISGSAHLSCP